jgi:DNA polymerase I-like protein with 3'-5' exonuclease and polymerase domains
MGKFGDEDGLLWLPPPAPIRTNAAGGKRLPRIHVPRGPLPESNWTAPTDFPRLSGVIALDFENHDPRLLEIGSNWCRPGVGDVAGISIAWPDGERYYPVGHKNGHNLDRSTVYRYIGDLAKNPDVRFVCHNLPYDLGWLWGRMGIKPFNVPYDTQAAVALLDEFRSRNGDGYNLNAVGRDYCNVLKDETLLNEAAAYFGLDPKADMWMLDPKYVGPYGEGDAGLTLQVWQTVEPMLRAAGLWELFMLEMRYCVVITAMRMNGVRVDTDRAVRYRDELLARAKADSVELKKLTGFEVPALEKGKVQQALEARGIECPRTPAGNISITSPWLKTLDDPVAKLIVNIRRLDKVRTTFIEGFFLELATNGRVYPQINPLPTDDAGTISGRSSCTNPNLQQLSAKDPELARDVRGCCLPEEGAEWAALDYSQQEPRLAVHFAYLAGVRGAATVVQQYRRDPRTDFHNMVNALANGIGRGRAKILNLAMIYGKGEAATCHDLGFETEWIQTRYGPREVAGPEGKAFIENYHRLVPFVSGLKDACIKAVKKRGQIRTLLGRLCRFGEGKNSNHKAVNALVQGSAADQLKKANVDIYEETGQVPLVNVHDEIGLNKWSDAQIDRCSQIMVETTPLEVPIIVDVATGKNWGEAL